MRLVGGVRVAPSGERMGLLTSSGANWEIVSGESRERCPSSMAWRAAMAVMSFVAEAR